VAVDVHVAIARLGEVGEGIDINAAAFDMGGTVNVDSEATCCGVSAESAVRKIRSAKPTLGIVPPVGPHGVPITP